ncbi:MAG: hypothetical protein LKJ88_05780 [Bacilli bacterium]|jgi:hypothetical protein|nr:hypothetical protein [Bacilli bacterium]
MAKQDRLAVLSPTKPHEAQSTSRLMLSLGSQLFTAFSAALTYIFMAFDILKFTYKTRPGTSQEIYFTGYDVFSKYNTPVYGSFQMYFILFSLLLSGLIIIFFLLEIFTLSDIHGANIILLGLHVLCLEFLLSSFSVGGFLFFALSFLSWIQYFFCLSKHREIDWWVFIGMLLLDFALLPSALAASSLFAS